MAASDDFFGLSYVSPEFAQADQPELARRASARSTPSSDPALSPQANMYMTSGGQWSGSAYDPSAPPWDPGPGYAWSWDPNAVAVDASGNRKTGYWGLTQTGVPALADPNSPTSSTTRATSGVARTNPNPGSGDGTAGERSLVNVGDLGPIRGDLQEWLRQMFSQPATPYGGSLEVPMSPYFQSGIDLAQSGAGMLRSAYEGAQAIPSMLLPMMQQAWGAANSLGNNVSGFAQQMMQTGGAPDITAAMNAIRSKGMLDLQDSLANIRETYGNYGLGRSSDIVGALATGASRGIADINSQQSQLALQVLSDAANRRLAGGNLMLGADSARANLLPQLMNSWAGVLGMPASIGIGAGQGTVQAASPYLAAGSSDMQRLAQNVTLPYQEFLRTSQQYPFLNSALAFATGFPPTQQQPIVQNSGSGMWGALGSVAGSVLPYLLLSSRQAKENIRPAEPISEKLKALPIYRWNYKGDSTPHVGPMAEEFRDAFGVGDGVTLNPVDLFGVMLAATKEMVDSHA